MDREEPQQQQQQQLSLKLSKWISFKSSAYAYIEPRITLKVDAPMMVKIIHNEGGLLGIVDVNEEVASFQERIHSALAPQIGSRIKVVETLFFTLSTMPTIFEAAGGDGQRKRVAPKLPFRSLCRVAIAAVRVTRPNTGEDDDILHSIKYVLEQLLIVKTSSKQEEECMF